MNRNIYKNNWGIFFIRVILPTLLTICLFILTIFFIIIPRFKTNIMNGKREMIKELTNSAWSILVKYEKEEKNGILSKEEAQNRAIERIQYLRYGEENKDYFWITDLHPNMVMHPYRPDLNGKDLTDLKDPHGKRLFVEFVKVVQKQGHGYVDYMWQWKDDSLHIVPKLSYVKNFKPWNWIIGTGIYIEDVKKEIASLTGKMIRISIGITALITLLLIFIAQQSIRLEQKRKDAEALLMESREKYKTLVEAATEGLMMIMDGRITYSNNVISKLTGYDQNELNNLKITEIISDDNITEITGLFVNNIAREGQYEVRMKKKNGGILETLLTISPISFSEKNGHIIIVKDITIDQFPGPAGIEYQRLIDGLNLGFFRTTIDMKGRFVSANESAIKILGFTDAEELSRIYILDLFKDIEDRKNFRDKLISKGFVKNHVLRLKRKDDSIAIVSVSVVVINDDNNIPYLCDGIIEDITQQTNKTVESENLIAELRNAQLFIYQPVKKYKKTFVSVDLNASINKVISMMARRKSDVVIITKESNDYIGILTDSDLKNRVLAVNYDIEKPVFGVMSSPIVSVFEEDSIYHAISIGIEKLISHLAIKNSSSEITGILNLKDLIFSLQQSFSFLENQIQQAETDDELLNSHKSLFLLIRPLLDSLANIKYISSVISSISDLITNRIISLSIKELGEPPARFAFIALGSEGRKEQTLVTDQDNAIIFEDVAPDKKLEVNDYFNRLGESVCNRLNYIGYQFCKGHIMAKNPKWCKPYSEWEQYFSKWINTPEPQNLLEVLIFFDFRTVYGDLDFAGNLRAYIANNTQNKAAFFYHLAQNAASFKPGLNLTGNILMENIHPKEDVFDIKHAIVPIIMFARIYSLKNDIRKTHTLERLNDLYEKQIINFATFQEITYAYNFLMQIRIKHQAILMDLDLTPNNYINPKKLLEAEIIALKKIFSQISSYQTRLNLDFKGTF